MCECTYNFIQWRNRVRTMTFRLRLFGSLRDRVQFGSSSCIFFISGFWFGSFLLGSGSFQSLLITQDITIYCFNHFSHICSLSSKLMAPQSGPQNPTKCLQDGEGWATGQHQFLITTHLWKVDENVDPEKFGRLCSAFPHLGFVVPVGVGWAGPALGDWPCWSLGSRAW